MVQLSKNLQSKVDQVINLIQHAVKDRVVEVAYSGGKDSDVILELTKMAGVKYRAIYKNTTIDPPGTLKHYKSKGVEIIRPKDDFFTIVAKHGLSNRAHRMCCHYLKEYKILDDCIQGIRRCESVSRAKRYSPDDPIVCRVYSKSQHVNVILPILTWTNRDEYEFITKLHIQCHPLYYDEQGEFHVERRLGCWGCPLTSDQGMKDFLKNPRYLRPLVRAVKKFWETHPNSGITKKYVNPYVHIARNIFFRKDSDFYTVASADFHGNVVDWKEKLEKFFNIELP